MIFLKSLVSGALSASLMWVVIIGVLFWRSAKSTDGKNPAELGAIAGGWNHLLQMPFVIALLAVAFAGGLYFAARQFSLS